MKLISNDKSFLFSSTDIPDVFFTEYLPEANGDFIKVYFYIENKRILWKNNSKNSSSIV